jgi:hypothetical protein
MPDHTVAVNEDVTFWKLDCCIIITPFTDHYNVRNYVTYSANLHLG